MNVPTRSSFRIRDAVILVAAIAIGCGFARWPIRAISSSYRPSDSVLTAIYVVYYYYSAALIAVTPLSVVVLGYGLARHDVRLRDRLGMTGMLACLAAIFGVLLQGSLSVPLLILSRTTGPMFFWLDVCQSAGYAALGAFLVAGFRRGPSHEARWPDRLAFVLGGLWAAGAIPAVAIPFYSFGLSNLVDAWSLLLSGA